LKTASFDAVFFTTTFVQFLPVQTGHFYYICNKLTAMKVADYVNDKVNRFKEGYVFTYTNLNIPTDKADAGIKALNRMVKSGKLKKISKGRYYKPQKSVFGELRPDEYQIVKDLLEKDGKAIGYITGYSVFNRLSLTTQVSNTIQIGMNNEKNALTRGKYKIRFIKQTNQITKENIPLLQILDSIRFIKSIPDTNVNQSCIRIMQLIKDLSEKDLNRIKKLVIKYNASTRSLTGAMIETMDAKNEVKPILESLNPTTKYKIGVSEEVLANKEKWNII
jgi:predicted transcriptional regulator of viral defense system